MVKMETVGRRAKTDCASPSATRIQLPTPAPSRRPYSLANEPTSRPISAAQEHAAKKVVLADGAEWIWNLADLHFSEAIQIVDLYYSRQHLWELARYLHPNDAVRQKAWMRKLPKRLLDKGIIEKLAPKIRSINSTTPKVVEKLRIDTNSFERDTVRMRYPELLRQHSFVGSGVIEAGCKTVIGSRLKQFSMFWTFRRANAIAALQPAQRTI